MKYRKKPIIVDAVQFTEEMENHPEHWPLLGIIDEGTPETIFAHPTVRTLEGDMDVEVGDWIITGAYGEKYPCKDFIFRQTYEKVEEHP